MLLTLLLVFVFLGVATVAVAIAVAVVIAVATVTVAAVGGGGAVEKDGHVGELLVLVVTLDHGEHVALHEVGTDNEDVQVGPLGDDARVGHNLHGRTVEEDEVVLAVQGVEQVLQLGVEEQLGGVGRYGAHGDDIDTSTWPLR